MAVISFQYALVKGSLNVNLEPIPLSRKSLYNDHFTKFKCSNFHQNTATLLSLSPYYIPIWYLTKFHYFCYISRSLICIMILYICIFLIKYVSYVNGFIYTLRFFFFIMVVHFPKKT